MEAVSWSNTECVKQVAPWIRTRDDVQ